MPESPSTSSAPDVEAIRERLAKATPAPWQVVAEVRPINEFAHFSIQTVNPDANASWSVRFIAWMTGGRDITPQRFAELDRWTRDKLIDDGVRPENHAKPDADFIAHAPSDIAALLEAYDATAKAIRVVLDAFDNGLLVRAVDRDDQPDWAMRYLPVVRALAELENAAARSSSSTPTNNG